MFSIENLPQVCIKIGIVDDEALEGNQTFVVILDSSDSGVLLGNSNTTVIILDNDGITAST